MLEAIDTAVAPADNKTIPLVGSACAAGDLVGASAILKFGATLERKAITANTATSVTVGVAFSQSPTDDGDGCVQCQFSAECSSVATSNYFIMERSRGAAGTLDAAGVWTLAVNPVTEFCSDSNHDPGGDTQQESRHHDACWETIVKSSWVRAEPPGPVRPRLKWAFAAPVPFHPQASAPPMVNLKGVGLSPCRASAHPTR